MRVRVQHAGACRASEQEAYEEVGVVVALLLRASGDHRGQRGGTVQPLGDEHGVADRHDVGTDLGSSRNAAANARWASASSA